MNYKLNNKTKIPNKTIEDIIDFVCPAGVGEFNITFHYADKGVAYCGLTYVDIKRIDIMIAKEPLMFPRMSYCSSMESAGYTPSVKLKNFTELLVLLMSHELRHLWQRHVSKKSFHSNKLKLCMSFNNIPFLTNVKMEKDACEYANKMIKRYRRITS